MEHIEMIDKLRDKAGITREEAADALTRANWDMLEALVILEREGKIAPLTSSVATVEQTAGSGSANGIGPDPSVFGAKGYYYGPRAKSDSLWTKFKNLLVKSVTHSFVVRRRGRELLSLPVLVLLIVVISLFKLSAVALLIGLFCECRYSIEERRSTDADPNGAGGADGRGEV
jgi:hypothetical protein